MLRQIGTSTLRRVGNVYAASLRFRSSRSPCRPSDRAREYRDSHEAPSSRTRGTIARVTIRAGCAALR